MTRIEELLPQRRAMHTFQGLSQRPWWQPWGRFSTLRKFFGMIKRNRDKMEDAKMLASHEMLHDH